MGTSEAPSKACTLCRETKPLEEFPRQRNKTDGRSCWCKPCHSEKPRAWRLANPEQAKKTRKAYEMRNPTSHRRSHLRRSYGIEEADYDRLLDAQDGCCRICGAREADSAKAFLCVDHIAGTVLIRGLLCSTCNSAIGLLRHDVELLKRAIEYLGAPPVLEGVTVPRGVHRSRALKRDKEE